MRLVAFDRYRPRLPLESELVGMEGRHQHWAFDIYQTELRRADGLLCASTTVYPKPPRQVPTRPGRAKPPRLRIVGKPRENPDA